jgi:hypothetical protein
MWLVLFNQNRIFFFYEGFYLGGDKPVSLLKARGKQGDGVAASIPDQCEVEKHNLSTS